MKDKIPALIKATIIKNAKNRCEYCRIQDKLFYYSFHIDHIKSLKHFGESILNNLAYSCPECNLNKGTDLGTYNIAGEFIRFFNPRIDIWEEHFYIKEGKIEAITEIGEATIKIFKMNEIERLIFRKQLIEIGQF